MEETRRYVFAGKNCIVESSINIIKSGNLVEVVEIVFANIVYGRRLGLKDGKYLYT